MIIDYKKHCFNVLQSHKLKLDTFTFKILCGFLEKEEYDNIHAVCYELYSQDKYTNLYKELFWTHDAALLLYLYKFYDTDKNVDHSINKYMSLLSKDKLQEFEEEFCKFSLVDIISNRVMSNCEISDLKDGLGELFMELYFEDDESVIHLTDILASHLAEKAIEAFKEKNTDYERIMTYETYAIKSSWEAYCYVAQHGSQFDLDEFGMDSIVAGVCEEFSYIYDITESVLEKITEIAENYVIPGFVSDDDVEEFSQNEADCILASLEETTVIDQILKCYKDEGWDIDELVKCPGIWRIHEIVTERLLKSDMPPEPLHMLACDFAGYDLEFEKYLLPSVFLTALVFHRILGEADLIYTWQDYKSFNIMFDCVEKSPDWKKRYDILTK